VLVLWLDILRQFWIEYDVVVYTLNISSFTRCITRKVFVFRLESTRLLNSRTLTTVVWFGFFKTLGSVRFEFYILWFKKNRTPTIFSNKFNKYWSTSTIFGIENLQIVSNVHILCLRFFDKSGTSLGEFHSSHFSCSLKTHFSIYACMLSRKLPIAHVHQMIRYCNYRVIIMHLCLGPYGLCIRSLRRLQPLSSVFLTC